MRLENVRFSFLNVLLPRAQKNDKGETTEKYSANLLMEKDGPDHKACVAAIEAVAVAQWGTKAEGILRKLYQDNRVALKDGDKELDKNGDVRQGYEGMMSLRTSAGTDNPPRMFSRSEKRITLENKHLFKEDTDKVCEAGDYGEALVRFWAQDNADPSIGRRINCQLVGIQFVRKGESLSRRELSDDELVSQFSTKPKMSLEYMAS